MIRFSKSKLNTFLSCPEKYYLFYELGLRSPKSSPTLVEGSCIHHLVEAGVMYRDRIDDVLEQASLSFWLENTFERCGYETQGEYLAAQAKCFMQAQAFLDQLGPVTARHIELRVDTPLIHPITLVEHPEITLTGFIDMVLVGPEGDHCVVDLKSVQRMPREGMSRVALELTLYAYLYSMPFEAQALPAIPVALVYLIRTRTPQVHFDESRRSMAHFVELYNICRKVAQDIEQWHFWKNPGIHCSWCDAASACYGEEQTAIATFGRETWDRYREDQERRQEINLPDVVNL